MPLIKDVFHPASYTVDCSLSGLLAKFKVCTLHACKSSNLEIAHVLCNLKIGMPSQDSKSAQRNLKIAQILRLCETYTNRDCEGYWSSSICPVVVAQKGPGKLGLIPGDCLLFAISLHLLFCVCSFQMQVSFAWPDPTSRV